MSLSVFLTTITNWLLINYHAIAVAGWTAWLTLFLILFFTIGVVSSIRVYLHARHTIRHHIDVAKPTLKEVQKLADNKGEELPFIIIMVPAKDESRVIANTIIRLAQIDYPTERYAVAIITDEREKSDNGSLTTIEIASVWADDINRDLAAPWLYVINVPEWFSGKFGCTEKTFSRSTKGRALNYALHYLHDDCRLSQADMLGVLDADGRIHTEVLREVAFKRINNRAQVLQGPVFQISNYWDVTLSAKAAGIELSIYHLSSLARRLLSKKMTAEFLAGTNYFIDLHTMIDLGGWNEQALVEDAELGLRLFLEKNIKPEWLSCYEIEQTPPDYHVYLKQRQRWSLGHFQLLPMIRNSGLPISGKIALYWRVMSAIFKSPVDIGLPVLGWIALLSGWHQGLTEWISWVMLSLLIFSLFVWDFFGRGYHMIKKYAPGKQRNWLQNRFHQLHFIIAMPWLIFLQAQPRFVAIFQYLTGFDNDSWVKTKRTVEEPLEVIPKLGARKVEIDKLIVAEHENVHEERL
ncbi:hypothetical protein A9Q78_10670 [Methylophaga sp. 41_12_T18]|nr:hypothetical protein A9Q78_10670 [Methylophaga sp. 41_12_T18]